jgi:hypothetical protein
MVAGAGYVMSRQETPARASTGPQREVPAGGLLDSIKEEMFALERDRLEKKIDEAEYQRVRAALEVVLARAIDRQANKARA